MRIFYALELDSASKAYINDKVAVIRSCLKAGRPIDIFNLHVTIVYVGEIDDSKLPFYVDVLEKAVEGIRPSAISFDDICSFRRKGGHLIFLRGNSTDEVEKIRGRIINSLGLEQTPFLSHVTLCRDAVLKEGCEVGDLSGISGFDGIRISADSISLMESKRINGRLVYISLHNVGL
jgi:RNA 2',3'-cyclic 3'-phosphodiesterase